MILLLASLLCGNAAADIAVLPPGVEPARAEVLRAALADAAGDDVTLLSAEDFARAVQVVSVDGRPGADECEARVPVDDWRLRFEQARSHLQLLAFTEALAALVALDAELVCLSTPPATSDLFRLELSFAEAHTFLAASAGRDAGKKRFHHDEADAALTRAAAFGAALSPPADLSPEVLAAYEDVRRRSEDERPRVLVAGPGARVGARFNGRPLPEGPFDGVVGNNLVQAATGAEVTAAERLRLTGGRTLVWLAPARSDALAMDIATALGQLRPGPGGSPARTDPHGQALLAAAARLVGDGTPVLFVVDGGNVLLAYAPADPRPDAADELLVARPPLPLRPAPLDTWRAAIGAGPSAGWTNLGAGPLDGLGGPHVGVSVYGRVAVNEWVAVAATLDPWAVAAAIPAAQGGGTLFRATIPATVGVRFGPHTRGFALEGGVDAGIHAFGAFEESGVTRQRMSFLAAGTVGVSGALGPRIAARAQGWFGAGLGYVGGGGSLGLEGRL